MQKDQELNRYLVIFASKPTYVKPQYHQFSNISAHFRVKIKISDMFLHWSGAFVRRRTGLYVGVEPVPHIAAALSTSDIGSAKLFRRDLGYKPFWGSNYRLLYSSYIKKKTSYVLFV